MEKKNFEKMFKFDYVTKEDIKEHNSNWPEIAGQPYRKLLVEGSGSRKKMNYLVE